jgi:hypothetical protein
VGGAPPTSPLTSVVAGVFGGNASANLGLAGGNPDDDPQERRKKIMAAVGGTPDNLASDRLITPEVLALFK